jgi:hypothetical protein
VRRLSRLPSPVLPAAVAFAAAVPARACVFLPLLAALIAAPAAAQQATLIVTVVDSATGAPLPGARVTLGGRARGSTDSAGVARVGRVPVATEQAVAVERLGHATRWAVVPIEPGENQALVAMAPAPLAVRGVEARARPTARSARVEEFYRRSERGGTGYFVTRTQMDRYNPLRASDLLRRIPGLAVSVQMDGSVLVQSARAQAGPHAGCKLQFYVDGMLDTSLENGGEGPNSLDRVVDPDWLEGIEVYLGSNTPARYGGVRSGRCGVVLIWTRGAGR